ncbi:MAG: class I SAM-dependent methyltransferase [Bacteroidota bacterium]
MNVLNFFANQSTSYLHGGGAQGTEHLLRQLNLSGRERLLEIGVGTGATLVALKSTWPDLSIAGVEVNPRMVQKAKARLRFCGLPALPIHLLASEANYPFPDQHFDRIVVESVLAIQSLPELSKLFTEIERVLHPQGSLVFNETLWLPNQDVEQIRAFNQACLKHFGIIQSNDDLIDVTAWKNWLDQRGWKITYCEKIEDCARDTDRRGSNRRSEWFTRLGKLSSRLSQGHRQEAKELQLLEKQLFHQYPLRLNAYLFVVQRLDFGRDQRS